MIDDTLEAEFALRKRHPERDMIYDEHKRRSATVRAESVCVLDQRYAEGPRCLLDIFPAGDRAPVLFFVHGGYWRALDKSYVSFIAEPFRQAGITVVMPGYDLVPSVRIGGIVDQMRRGVRLDRQTARTREDRGFGSLRRRSTGRHAGARSGRARRRAYRRVGDDQRRFRLTPSVHTSINADLNLSAEEAAEASPLLRVRTLMERAPLVPLLAIVGGDETRGFGSGRRI